MELPLIANVPPGPEFFFEVQDTKAPIFVIQVGK